MERKRTVHQLETPFSAVQWPQISQEDQDVILELLCSFLSPLGTYGSSCIAPSKGKRSKAKRKLSQMRGDEPEAELPPLPELAAHIDVGLASISRRLEAVSTKQKSCEQSMAGSATTPSASVPAGELYSVIFVSGLGPSSSFHSHFPQMVAVASRSSSLSEATRLVRFSRGRDDRLSAALGIPRVSSIGIRGNAPNSTALVGFVRSHVAPVEIAWLEEARAANYRETKINSTTTSIGLPKKVPNKK